MRQRIQIDRAGTQWIRGSLEAEVAAKRSNDNKKFGPNRENGKLIIKHINKP